MVNGAGSLIERFSGMAMDSNTGLARFDSPNDNLMQVMKAVEAAETTIKQQVQEITKLHRKIWELENYKSDASNVLRPPAYGPRDAYEHVPEPYKAHPSVSPSVCEEERVRWMDNSSLDSQATIVIHANILHENNNPALQTAPEGQHFSQSSKTSGTLKVISGGQAGVGNASFSQMSSLSSRSLSPNRNQKEGSGHGTIERPEISNPGSLWKQDLFHNVRELEEEIVQLQKQLAEYAIKGTQIRNEKYILEKRIAYMRLAFDQQQQDLVDAASKALSYRQDIIEENIRLTYALQAAEQERSIFVSSLLPLLAEYDLQPHVLDAQSIVSDVKILIQHLREKLNFSELKLKESQYQLVPWRSDVPNNSTFPPQSPSHSGRAQPTILGRSGQEIVPQPVYSHTQTPISSPSNPRTTRSDWEMGQHDQHTGSRGAASKNLDLDNLGRPPPASRNAAPQDIPAQLGTQSDTHGARLREENVNSDFSFNDVVSSPEMDDTDAIALQNERGFTVHFPSGISPYLTPVQEEPNSSYSPNLPPVLEEPSSSFSEAAEDDPLPGIDGLQIAGDAYPGRKLLACGFSINGTNSCNFEWVRCLQDGSVNYIQGANQPTYLVTADDVDTYLAIEVVPLDNRKRKGKLVKVFANDQRKITCDPDMQGNIEKFLFNGHASFEVSLSAGCLDIYEPALLYVKREGYSIKCNEPRGAVVTEKFSPNNLVTIPHGQETEFSILSSNGTEYLLRTTDNSSLRDAIVLTMRLFIERALEKRKGKKTGLFFGK